MELSERLRHARTRAGLTQQDVATHFRIARVSVTQWESGISRPDQTRFTELAALFSVPLAWLMDERGEAPSPIGSKAHAKSANATVIKRPKPRKLYIREWRTFTHSAVTELAKAIGREPDYYEYLEAYPYKVSIEHLDIIARKMGVQFDQLWFPPPADQKPAPVPAHKRAKKA